MVAGVPPFIDGGHDDHPSANPGCQSPSGHKSQQQRADKAIVSLNAVLRLEKGRVDTSG